MQGIQESLMRSGSFANAKYLSNNPLKSAAMTRFPYINWASEIVSKKRFILEQCTTIPAASSVCWAYLSVSSEMFSETSKGVLSVRANLFPSFSGY
jgi:hypothetical protein